MLCAAATRALCTTITVALFWLVNGNVASEIRSFPRSLKHSPPYPLELLGFYVFTIRSLHRCVLRRVSRFIFEPYTLQGLPRLCLAKMQRFIFRCVFVAFSFASSCKPCGVGVSCFLTVAFSLRFRCVFVAFCCGILLWHFPAFTLASLAVSTLGCGVSCGVSFLTCNVSGEL